MATKLTKTNDELQVDCEVAAEIIAAYFARCANRLAAEKRKSCPNEEMISALESQLRELHQERMLLGVDNTKLIEKALYIYSDNLGRAKTSSCFVLTGETDAFLIDSFKSLQQKFIVPESQEVSEFLFDFQDLMPFLEEVHSALRPIFPTEQLSLKLIDDGSEAAELALFVHVDGEPFTELERLSNFQESWWLENWARADNKVTVDLRYS